jgi:EXS family
MSGTQEVGEIFGAGRGASNAMLRSPTVLIASVGLWGMNIYLFKLFSIDYVKVLNHDLIKLEEQMDRNDQQQEQSSSQQHMHNGRSGRIRSGAGCATKVFNFCRANSEYDMVESEMSPQNAESTKLGAMLQETRVSGTDSGDEEHAVLDVSHNHHPQHHLLHDNDHLRWSEEITAGRLIVLSITLLVLLHGTYTIWLDILGGEQIGAVFAFYGAVTMAILFPLPSNRWLRISAVLTLQRAYELIRLRHPYVSSVFQQSSTSSDDDKSVVKIPRPIPFIDVFFADAMCSLSKVFFDWGLLLHMAAYYPKPVPKTAYHILIPSAFAAVPFLIRARQCMVMWNVTSLKNDPGRYQHLWNALKYCTSIFPLCLSAYQRTVLKDRAHELEPVLILLLIVNASYALWWDVGK